MMWIILGIVVVAVVLLIAGQDIYSRGFRAGMECQIALHELLNKFGANLNEKAEDWRDEEILLWLYNQQC